MLGSILTKGFLLFNVTNTFNMEETTSPLVYTPAQPKQQAPQAPQYQLKNDVTGQPAPSRKKPVIKALIPEAGGSLLEVLVEVPKLPSPSCNNCYGRGYVGYDIKSKKIVFCHKCYKK